MDWSGLLARDDGVRLQSAVTEDALRLVEADLGAGLADALRGLYRFTDGVWDEPGQWYVIWPLAEVALRNRNEAGLRLPHDLIAFGDDGTGDPWCVRRDGEPAVYAWSSIDQEATRLADDLPSFWSAWVANALPPH